MTGDLFEGGCQCGAVRYRARGTPMVAAICHCSMCRRAHAAPAVGWAMFQKSQVVFTGALLREFASSEEARRGFCGACGHTDQFYRQLPPRIDRYCAG